MRLLFYSAPFAVREAAFAAFSDGAKLIHHTYSDAAYASVGWLGVAMSSIRSRHPLGYASAAITRADASSATESSTTSAPVVSRRHLEVFSELYPRQISETWALNVWMNGVYADDAPTAVANGGSGSDTHCSDAIRGASCPRRRVTPKAWVSRRKLFASFGKSPSILHHWGVGRFFYRYL